MNKTIQIPDNQHELDNGGCFGSGPGTLTVPDPGLLFIPGTVFIKTNQVYEIQLRASKGERESKAKINLEIIKNLPPIIDIACLIPHLCNSDNFGNIYINPTTRAAFTSRCDPESDCSLPMIYKWSVKKNSEIIGDEFISMGLNQSDLSIMSELFVNSTTTDLYEISLSVTNSKGIEAQAATRLKINNPPFDGSCDFNPKVGTSLTDKFEIICENWKDPEDRLITSYVVKAFEISNSQEVTTLLVTTDFDGKEPKNISPGSGVFRIEVTIIDDWGSKVTYIIPNQLVVKEPSVEEFQNFNSGDEFENLKASGDVVKIVQVLGASATALDKLSVNIEVTPSPLEVQLGTQPLSPQEKAEASAVAVGKIKLNLLDTLNDAVDTNNIQNVQSGLSILETVDKIFGNDDTSTTNSQENENVDSGSTESTPKQLSNVGIELTDKAVGTITVGFSFYT